MPSKGKKATPQAANPVSPSPAKRAAAPVATAGKPAPPRPASAGANPKARKPKVAGGTPGSLVDAIVVPPLVPVEVPLWRRLRDKYYMETAMTMLEPWEVGVLNSSVVGFFALFAYFMWQAATWLFLAPGTGADVAGVAAAR